VPAKRGLPSTLKMRHDRHYVEELSSLRGAPIGRMISIDRLEPNPQQPRVEIGDLGELIASVRERGILEPLLVRPSEVGGRFMIISGERRYRAAREVGLREIPCIEMDVDDRAVAEIALIENLQRKDLTPFEEGDGLRMLAERFGYTHEEIARKIGKARSSITEALAIGGMPAEIRDQCRRADISSRSLLLQIVRQSSPEEMRRFLSRVVEQGMTRDDARKARGVKSSRPEPYRFRYQGAEGDFVVEIRFRRSDVDLAEVRSALQQAIEHSKKKTT
jgi:ParB family transcriptional regulator, chromosome partitioning protein